jgi:F420-non-reducing hydrogenase iron-sulfur subunit
MRLNYPTSIKIVKVPCTGKVDVIHILKAMENGADGVYLVGCMEGDCHFLKGNLRAKKRVQHVKQLLEEVGVSGQRVEMFNLSASQAPRFVQIAREMSERIARLGPSPIRIGSGPETDGAHGTEPEKE